MRKDLEQKLANRWPNWFDLDGDPHQTCMSRGFQHGDGWFNLVSRLCEQIEEVVDEQEQPFKVEQVKEKFGGLRFYTNSLNNAIFTLVQTSELESFRICEVCGKGDVAGRQKDSNKVRRARHNRCTVKLSQTTVIHARRPEDNQRSASRVISLCQGKDHAIGHSSYERADRLRQHEHRDGRRSGL
jgi:hypothetical protein